METFTSLLLDTGYANGFDGEFYKIDYGDENDGDYEIEDVKKKIIKKDRQVKNDEDENYISSYEIYGNKMFDS